VASYRDENCLNTITQAYSHAQFPDKLNIGLVQQNCVQDCMSGVLKNQETEPVEPDEDCYQLFCESQVGKPHCEAHRVRVLKVDESESLGPYTARYFASKLWNGESWFMQIDSHSTFAQGWDADSISMLQNAPSEKPVISHYPPNTEGLNFRDEAQQPARRICDATFSDFDLDSQIVRLEDNEPWDNEKLDIPRFAPFIAAGYFVAHSGILKEVPFDPFLPWVFMGEEIIMSARFWTHGYDIFSPTHSVVGHMYVRRYKPKYWESVDRFLWDGVDTLVQDLVLHRVKDQLGYPESAPDLVRPKSVFFGVEHYTMGSVRSIEDYMKMVGLDPVRKEANNIDWCQTGQPPEYAKDKSYLYSSSTKSPAQK
jgi:[Skp1-protein]-hydroxyproline N-acetylglucosaminyltransferase